MGALSVQGRQQERHPDVQVGEEDGPPDQRLVAADTQGCQGGAEDHHIPAVARVLRVLVRKRLRRGRQEQVRDLWGLCRYN